MTLAKLIEAVKLGNNRTAVELAQELLNQGVSEETIITEGLSKALEALDVKCTTEEFNLVEILLAGRAMMDVLDQVLRPRLVRSESTSPTNQPVIVLGTIRGDIHDLGKKVVGTIMSAAGLKVIDLGTDVAPEEFVQVAKEENALFIGISSLLTITFAEIRKVKELAIAEGLKKVRVIAGGAAVRRTPAEYLNVDYVASEDLAAWHYIKKIVEEEKRTNADL